ncbi:[protein-PII] uridylyltransferase, partial [Alphaproteobacteria bacterium]|nr:[protein-PII] uridylyltransferase [Alphaproteobacteria bacterium]
FGSLIKNNNGVLFNKSHGNLVDQLIIEIVKDIQITFPVSDFCLIAVGGYGRHDLSPKSDVDLLFIYKKSNKNIRDFITQLNNTLWDIGLEVGISFLTIKQALIDSKKDIKTITKFVETRFIIGDEIQYGEFVRSIKILIGKQNPLKLSELKLIELVERHDYRIGIKSNLEPNIKEGIGGLRDIHTILWVSIFMFNIYKLEDLTSINIYTKEEIKELKNAWKFLLTIRAFIHLFNESKGDVLSIENQLKISKKLSYKDKKKEKGVEIFMKDLFVNVAKINSLLRTFYSKLPEDLIIKTIYKRKPTKTKSLEKEFIIEKGFLNLKNNTPKNLQLKWANVFEKSLEHNLLIHPRFLKTVEEKRKVLKKSTDKQHLQSFLNIVVSKKNPIQALHDFNDTQLFSEIFPEFGRVWGQVQFDIYHHYTTDEHLLLTLHNLNELRQKSFYNEIYSRLSSREALHIALLFHDIGKKGPKNHSVYGTELTKKILKRLPVSEEVKELTLWLVENHLAMSDTAFKNDTQSPEAIAKFTSIANTEEKINSLFLFTLCDIASVGPNVLNEWRISLLRSLFYNARDFLQRGLDTKTYSTSVQESLKKSVLQKSDVNLKKFIKNSINEFPNQFWEAFSSRMIVDIFKIYQRNKKAKVINSVNFLNYENKEYSAVVVTSKNRPGILKDIVSGFTHSQSNILSSRIISLNNNQVIDVFWVTNFLNKGVLDLSEQKRAAKHVMSALDQKDFKPLRSFTKGLQKLAVNPQITIDNDMSKQVTTFQILSGDRPGLLMDILGVFHDKHISVQSAKISTYGEKVFDIFQLTNSNNQKIKDEKLLKSIEKDLMSIF